MELIISLLIVYGCTLIITRGSIFEEPRVWFNDLVVKYTNWFFPNTETVVHLLVEQSPEIDQKHIDIHSKLIAFADSPEYQSMASDLVRKIQTSIIEKRNKHTSKKISLFILKKINKFINCQMCMGFWNGILLAILTIYYPIIIFTYHIQIVTSFDFVFIFTWGLIASGSTWAIDQIVEYFSNN